MKPIFDYLDYRRFLRDRFLEMKRKNPLFSYRAFNRLAGLKSSASLKLVLDGQRNLARDGIRCVLRGFKLNDLERRYFKALVLFNQAQDHEEKDRYFREICEFRQFLQAKKLTVAQYKLLSHWYYVAILELVRISCDVKKNARWFQKRLHPAVGLREVKSALAELKRLGLLEEDEKLGLRRKDILLATEEPARSLAVVNFHLQMNDLAARSVVQEKAKDREFSSLTVALSESGFQRAKEEIQGFRKRLHSLIEQEDGAAKTLVGQINLQLFRLSKPEDLS